MLWGQLVKRTWTRVASAPRAAEVAGAARLIARPPLGCLMQRGDGTSWINIDGSDDPGYRYKMPPAVVRHDKVGQSGHTILANGADIAKCLGRPPQYLCKHLALALGGFSSYDPGQGTISVRGAHSPQIVHELVRTFIRQWVVCGRCALPETSIVVTPGKRHPVIFDCKACGARSAADPESKLTSFIVNNPPNEKGTGLVYAADEATRAGVQERQRGAKEEARREREKKKEAAAAKRKEERKLERAAEAARRRADDSAGARALLGMDESSGEEEVDEEGGEVEGEVLLEDDEEALELEAWLGGQQDTTVDVTEIGAAADDVGLTTVVASLSALSRGVVSLMLTPRSLSQFPKLRPTLSLAVATAQIDELAEGGFANGATRGAGDANQAVTISPDTIQFCWACGCALDRWGCSKAPRVCNREAQLAAEAVAAAAAEAEAAAAAAEAAAARVLEEEEEADIEAAAAQARGRPDGLLMLVWKESVACKSPKPPAAQASDLLAVARAHSLSIEGLLSFVFEVVLDDKAPKQLTALGKLLKRLVSASKDRPACERHVLGCTERLLSISAHATTLAPKRSVHVLKALYDADVLSEESIVAWHGDERAGPRGRRLREAAAPFVTWLQEAEEDDE